MNRLEYFKNKRLLFFCFMFQVISFYLFIEFVEETYIFMIPVALFGFLGLLELSYIQSKYKGGNKKWKNKNK